VAGFDALKVRSPAVLGYLEVKFHR
jgi:hypothetical protein